MALQTKYPSPLAGYYGYGMSNYGLPQVSADSKFPYFNFGQNESLHSAMGYACKSSDRNTKKEMEKNNLLNDFSFFLSL